MLEVKEIEIRGARFQLTPMDPFKAKKCDTKVMKILAPILAGFMGGSVKKGPSKPAATEDAATEDAVLDEDDLQVDGAVLGKAFVSALGELEDSDQLFKDLFGGVVWLPDDTQVAGTSQLLLDSQNAISKAFKFIGAGPSLFYELAFEVARFNKFTPFVLLEGGAETSGTSGFGVLAKMKGLGLGRLGGLTT
jgi:hypothetical protein